MFVGPDFATVVPLLDPEPERAAQFGSAVAVGDLAADGSGDVIVGVPGSSVVSENSLLDDAGAVFVFHGSLDLDGDGLPDAIDPDPTDPDIDDDGIADGSDPDSVASALSGLPLGVFANNGDPAGQRNAMLSRLGAIEQAIVDGATDDAIRMLDNLLRRLDGCPESAQPFESPEADDWIIDCEAQREVRLVIESLIENLSA